MLMLPAAVLPEISDVSQKVSYMRDLVRALPLPNHNTMEVLFRHLCR